MLEYNRIEYKNQLKWEHEFNSNLPSPPHVPSILWFVYVCFDACVCVCVFLQCFLNGKYQMNVGGKGVCVFVI